MTEIKDLELIIESGTPIICVETIDEPRVEAVFKRLATRFDKQIYSWSVATGLQGRAKNSTMRFNEAELNRVLTHISQMKFSGLYVLFDVHAHLEDPLTIRLLRELSQNPDANNTIVLVAPELDVPQELKGMSAKFEFSLPTEVELEQIIIEVSADWGKKNKRSVSTKREVIDAMIRNLRGLTTTDARRLVSNAIYDDGILADEDLDSIAKEKYKLLDTDGVLSFEMDTARFNDVAGLRHLKDWLERRKKVFLSSDAPKGLDPSKGVLLLGVQGGGKSLAAKSVAGSWGIPLLRLDFGTLYNKYYGETERNLRQSLKTADVMSPCVLWIDEIEKGLSSGGDDGGPAKRILGTLLTWMAERESKVFLVATANDIEALPPELLRKGRFDEIFFIDLPKPDVRREIFRIHIAKRDQQLENIDLDELAKASELFSGAEIEQSVVSALYTAHAADKALSTEHILEEVKVTKPLAVLMSEKIAHLREWASERTVPAD